MSSAWVTRSLIPHLLYKKTWEVSGLSPICLSEALACPSINKRATLRHPHARYILCLASSHSLEGGGLGHIYISNAGIHCVTLMMIDSKLARFQTIIPKRIALAPITKCAFSYFCHIGRPLLPFVDGMVYSVVNAWAKLRAFFDNSNITPLFFRILRPVAVFRMSRARVQYLYL